MPERIAPYRTWRRSLLHATTTCPYPYWPTGLVVDAALAAGSKLVCTAADLDPDAALKLTDGYAFGRCVCKKIKRQLRVLIMFLLRDGYETNALACGDADFCSDPAATCRMP
eukprot:1464161-Rhodomonas_salina.1